MKNKAGAHHPTRENQDLEVGVTAPVQLALDFGNVEGISEQRPQPDPNGPEKPSRNLAPSKPKSESTRSKHHGKH